LGESKGGIKFVKLKVIAPNRVGYNTRVFLDEKEITISCSELNTATLKIFPKEIEFEGEVDAKAIIGDNEFKLKLNKEE